MKTNKRAEGQNGAFSGQSAPRGRGAVPLYGECPCAALLPRMKGQGITTAAALMPLVLLDLIARIENEPIK